MNIITRKIGLNKGKRRIWLEGAVLSGNHIQHGMRFDVVNSHNRLVIVIKTDGKRKVSGNPARPVIDMSAATITNSFDDTIKVVSVERGKLPRSLVLTGLK